MRTNRKLAAILFADIVGYTALMQQNETNAATLLRRFQQEMESMVSRHNGRIINFYGDGVLCVFDNPQEALRCAMAVQTNFRETPQVPVRMAVHSGTVVFEGDKIYGDSVNLTSRLESLGIAGAVLCSKKVRDEIKNQPDFELAGAYTLLGEKEKAYEWLEKTPYNGTLHVFLRIDPLFDPLRQEDRFNRILAEWDEQVRRWRNSLKSMEVDGQLLFSVEE